MTINSKLFTFYKDIFNLNLPPLQYIKFIQKEIKFISDDIKLGQMSISVNLPPTSFDKEIIVENSIIFEKRPDLSVEPLISEFTTFENGEFIFSCFPQKDQNWTTEDKNTIDFICHLLFVLLTRSNMNKLLQKAQETDFLTGSLNTKGFIRLGKSIFNKRLMPKFSVLFINIVSFRDINTKYSQSTGDIVLIKTVQKISKFMDKDGAIARLGADLFAVLIKKSRLADLLRFIETITIPVEIENVNGNQSISIIIKTKTGICEGNSNIPAFEAYLGYAQTALKISKDNINDSFVFYAQEMDELES